MWIYFHSSKGWITRQVCSILHTTCSIGQYFVFITSFRVGVDFEKLPTYVEIFFLNQFNYLKDVLSTRS